MPEIHVLLAVLIAALTGILSGWGIGGGTLLILILLLIFHAETESAQFINLAYFLPSAATSLFFHAKSGYIERKTVFYASICGCITTLLGYQFASVLSGRWLSIAFGTVLICLGVRELFANSAS